MVQAPKSGQNQGQSGVFLWSANYTPSGPQINRPGFLHQPSLGVTRTANENHHLVKMERPHLMDGGHGYYLPYHAGEEHIGVNKSNSLGAVIKETKLVRGGDEGSGGGGGCMKLKNLLDIQPEESREKMDIKKLMDEVNAQHEKNKKKVDKNERTPSKFSSFMALILKKV
ncbi:hypothetical protein GQR58_004073 [Nymphon striatum]|nr:hypothetical protein GQR58_004073 [Nymphon striatum]